MSEKQVELAAAEILRPELTQYCYRMLGSIFDADDAVQDTFIRAWQNWDQLREESSRRFWLYRIATNICLDKLRSAKRRALPMDLSGPTSPISEPQDQLPLTAWVWPAPGTIRDPAELVAQKDTIRLSFIAVLQTLPPRQRAVLILCDVFRWSAKESADALGMTAAGVNSALQRARKNISQANLRSAAFRDLDVTIDLQLLNRYVDAFEAYDIDALMALFHEDGSLSMPPFVMWVRGRSNLVSFYQATKSHCVGSRLVPVTVNGNTPAFAQYVPAGSNETLEPWGIHVLEVKDSKIAHIHTFIDAALYARFGLPSRLNANQPIDRHA
ncbi:sigma-70 family RNA polymerase sigma factor [Alicyclobacillus fodiniaquatilis]|uniref:Sigma-70 family RNA polymerase sigma factor n=1 Tax=Alicyclobacillus fodiniaquatilis TaxID=1661150 RepID=A0ABW4JL59_9BACL